MRYNKNMSKHTTETADGRKVWVEFDHEWDHDIPMAYAISATIENFDGTTFEVEGDDLHDFIDVEAVEEKEMEGMNYGEYLMDQAEAWRDSMEDR